MPSHHTPQLPFFKHCHRCKEALPYTEFHRDASRNDGLSNICKNCKSHREAQYRKRPEVKVRRREFFVKNGRKYIYDRSRYDAKKYAATIKAWHDRNPQASRAHKMLHAAIRAGNLPKAAECKCRLCDKKAAEYHHVNGYGEGHELDVIPLCRSCHRSQHPR